jgi:protease PrsW
MASATPAPLRSFLRGRGSLWRPREPAFWVWAGLTALGALLIWNQQDLLRSISPTGWALSWFLLLLYALPVLVTVYLLDLYEREPLSLVAGALLWGALAAAGLASLGNDGWGLVVARLGGPEFASRWTAALTAPIVEETLKGIGVVLVYLIARDEFDDAMDGFVYGAVCGLGFAIVEDVFYFVAVFGGTVGGVLTGFFVRVLASGLYSHVLYTGLVGMGIGIIVSRREPAPASRRWTQAGLLFAVAAAGHFLWNSPLLDFFPRPPWMGAEWILVPLATAVKGLPMLLFLATAVALARRRERRWLDQMLAYEVTLHTVSSDELATLRDPRRRRGAKRDMRRRAGAKAAALLGRLQREQMNLAMIRSRVGDDDDPALARQREFCRSLRSALQAMPGAAGAHARADAG